MWHSVCLMTSDLSTSLRNTEFHHFLKPGDILCLYIHVYALMYFLHEHIGNCHIKNIISSDI